MLKQINREDAAGLACQNKKTSFKNKAGTSMIKTCYLLKEKLTNVDNKTRCKMVKKNGVY